MRKWGLVAAGLALCVNILAHPGALSGDNEISIDQRVNVVETPAIALLEVCKQTEQISKGIHPLTEAIQDIPKLVLEPEPVPEQIPRYAGISMSDGEHRELAGIVYLEAANQCAEGQQAVVEVVFNRVISPDFPNTVHDVLHEGEGTPVPQFSTIGNLGLAEPSAAQYAAIDAALYGPSILPEDVVFFSRDGENDRVWGKIQDHVFCYKYIWE